MADYAFSYQLTAAPSARTDGCGHIDHDIIGVCREEGSDDPWVAVPGHHTTISLSASSVATIMAMPDDTGPERAAKNTAYKNLLVEQFAIRVNALETNWTPELMEQYMDNNDSAGVQATAINDYIVNVLGQSYPVEFQL